MVKKLEFKSWYDNRNIFKEDIFGFEKEIDAAQNTKNKKQVEELPVRGFNLETVMDRLGKNSLSGLGFPKSSHFVSEMQWGDQPGAMRVVWTPKLNIKIQRLHKDKEGNDVWILKKFFFVDDDNFGGKEDIVADEVYDQLKILVKEPLEHAPDMDSGYKLENLATSLASHLSRQRYDVLMFKGIKKLNENEYNLYFSLRGGGTGRSLGSGKGQRPVLEMITKVSYSNKNGKIYVLTNIVQGSDDNVNWTLQPADFEEYYLPSQNKYEIIETIVSSLKWY